jgi:O-antigen/teichoic acid export membrane protein
MAEGLAFTSAGNGLTKAVAFVGSSIIISELAVHDYGVVVLLMSFLAPVSTIVSMGLINVYVSTIARFRGEKNFNKVAALVKEYYISSFILLLVIFVAAYFLRLYLLAYYDIFLLKYFWIVILFIFVQILLNRMTFLLEAYERFKDNSILLIVETFSRVVLVIVLVSHLSIFTVLLIHILSKFLSFIVSIFFVAPVVRSWRGVSIGAERGILMKVIKEYGKWDILRVILDDVTGVFKVWIIKIFVNTESVGVYDFVHKIYSFASSLMPFQKILFPLVARFSNQKAYAEKIVIKSKKYQFIATTILLLILFVSLPILLDLFFAQYSVYLLIFYFYLIHLYIQIFRLGQSAFIHALKQQKFLLQVFPISLSLKIILDIILINIWGLFGAVVSWHLHVILLGLMFEFALRKKFNINIWQWKSFFSFDELDRQIIQRFVAGVKKMYQKI